MPDGGSSRPTPRRRQIADRDRLILLWLEVGLATIGAFGIIIAAAEVTLRFVGASH